VYAKSVTGKYTLEKTTDINDASIFHLDDEGVSGVSLGHRPVVCVVDG
jgi:hypothetical protein